MKRISAVVVALVLFGVVMQAQQNNLVSPGTRRVVRWVTTEQAPGDSTNATAAVRMTPVWTVREQGPAGAQAFWVEQGRSGGIGAGDVGLALQVRTPIEGRVVKGAPYSAEMVTESVQTLGDGNRIVRRS